MCTADTLLDPKIYLKWLSNSFPGFAANNKLFLRRIIFENEVTGERTINNEELTAGSSSWSRTGISIN